MEACINRPNIEIIIIDLSGGTELENEMRFLVQFSGPVLIYNPKKSIYNMYVAKKKSCRIKHRIEGLHELWNGVRSDEILVLNEQNYLREKEIKTEL